MEPGYLNQMHRFTGKMSGIKELVRFGVGEQEAQVRSLVGRWAAASTTGDTVSFSLCGTSSRPSILIPSFWLARFESSACLPSPSTIRGQVASVWAAHPGNRFPAETTQTRGLLPPQKGEGLPDERRELGYSPVGGKNNKCCHIQVIKYSINVMLSHNCH